MVLGPDSWAIDSAWIRDRDGRAIDPAGLELSAALIGGVETGDVASAEVVYDDGTRIEMVPVGANVVDPLYRARLTPTDRAAMTIEAVITDRVGRVRKHAIARGEPVEVVRGRLAIDAARLDGCLAEGDVFTVFPRGTPVLDVALNSIASVDWRLVGADGTELDGGTSEAAERRHRIPMALLDAATDSFSGTLHLSARDDRWVQRTDLDRGRDATRVRFVVHAEDPELIVRARVADGAVPRHVLRSHAQQPPSRIERLYTSLPELALEVEPTPTLPARVVVTWSVVDGEERLAAGTLEDDHVDARELSHSFVSPRLADGVYLVEVASKPLDAAAGGRQESLSQVRFELVVDTRAPTPSFDFVDGSAVTPAVLAASPPVRVRFGESRGAPVDLDWRFDGPHGRLPLAGDWPDRLDRGDELELRLPSSWADRPSPDGDYQLTLVATDLAGNPPSTAHLRFVGAVEGPQVEVREPMAGRTWEPGRDGELPVRVDVTDANGVASVLARLRLADQQQQCRLRRTTAVGAVEVWSGRLAVPPGWSHADVALEVEAADQAGNVSVAGGLTRALGTIEPIYPARVSVVGASIRCRTCASCGATATARTSSAAARTSSSAPGSRTSACAATTTRRKAPRTRGGSTTPSARSRTTTSTNTRSRVRSSRRSSCPARATPMRRTGHRAR